MAREGITRKSVDLTEAQLEVVQQMIEMLSTGDADLGTRQFFHLVLERQARELGLSWPHDYPTPGGWRGGNRNSEGDDA